MHKNPWLKLNPLGKIRVDNMRRIAECNWFVDGTGKYGYFVELKNITTAGFNINLQGIKASLNTKNNNATLILVLDSNEDWELFYSLCTDLTAASDNVKTVVGLVSSISNRLARWQSMLKMSKVTQMSKQLQMGLFTELYFLLNQLVPKVGVKQALISWVGPESDKQDFLLDNSVAEVKSYRTSKGPRVFISSAEQLYSEKDPLYLITYALSTIDKGDDIADLIDAIESEIEPNDGMLFDLFSDKLTGYGFIPESPGSPLMSFSVDKQKTYFISEEFPKIIPSNKHRSIDNVRYSIDLSECDNFLIKDSGFLFCNENLKK